MPSARRSPSRPGAGPGRGTRSRSGAAKPGASAGSTKASGPDAASAAPTGGASRPNASKPVDRVEPTADESRLMAVRRRSSLTTRAIALAVVLLVLTISYASSLRVYLSQRHDIAATRSEIADRQVSIADLQEQLDRWNDETYVKTQARQRLGWVVPGEIGYRVIGPDGKPVGTEQTGGSTAQPPAAQPRPWWSKLWGSVEAADAKPAPAAQPTKEPTITESTKPKR